MGDESVVPKPPRTSWLSAFVVFGPLALFAELLIRYTHHRPLAAATFAVCALVAWVLLELVVRRGLVRVNRQRALLRNIFWAFGICCSLAVFMRARPSARNPHLEFELFTNEPPVPGLTALPGRQVCASRFAPTMPVLTAWVLK